MHAFLSNGQWTEMRAFARWMPSGPRLGSNRETPAIPKSFFRNLDAGGSLLPFVLGAIHHPQHAPNEADLEPAFLRDLLFRMQFFDVVFEDRIQHVIRRKRVAVFLIGTQLR